MRCGILLIVAGCWSTREVAPVEKAAPTNAVIVDTSGARTASPRSASRSRDAFPRHSVWQGTYVCNQGLSAVTLTIDADHNGNATARYDFGPVPSNPSVPSGAYTLTGALRRQDGGGFAGDFEATEWIVHPPNYFMVAVSVESGDGRKMTGKIAHPSCRDFDTTRIE
jgi:hypothetical protein